MTQKEALDILKMGKSVYLTGAAGSGKTYLLNQYIAFLREHRIPVGITASTGIAATHMGGVTIHSWSGIGIQDALSERDLADLTKRAYLRSRFAKTKVLIIDEISMLHSYRLDMVDLILRTFRNSDEPFGGMQIVMCGDFFQLPPVTKREQQSLQPEAKADFVTESAVWQEMKLVICYLDEQFRQDDRAFLSVLNDIRDNDVSETTVEYLSERLNKDTTGYTKPTRLFTHNADVDAINLAQLQELEGEEHEYFMSSRGSFSVIETLRRSCLAPEKLVLKVGAQVMFVKNNFEAGYVNGTLGEVISFDENGTPCIRTYEGSEIAVTPMVWEVKDPAAADTTLGAIAQLPLRLAWAITVHKSQGMSLDAAEIDLSRSFTPGMGYVALSRVRSLSGLKLMGMNQMALTVNEQVLESDRLFRSQSDEAVLALAALDPEEKKRKQEAFLQRLQSK